MRAGARRSAATNAVTAGAAVLLLAGGAVIAYDRGGGGDGPDDGVRHPVQTRDTRYGASFQTRPGESYARALARTDETLGRLDMVRVFYPGAPDPWPGEAPGRHLVVSFKLDPGEVLAGRHDTSMRAWFADAPRDVDVHWVFWHEPEDDVEEGTFTAGEYQAAFERLDGLADEAANPRLRSTVVLMSWTTRKASGRDWRDFFPDPARVDVFAWDVYNPGRDGGYADPAALLDGARRAADSVGKPFAVAELGSVVVDGDDGSGRADWLRSMSSYLEEQDAEFVAYFDFSWNGGADDYRLRDDPSVQAWKDISSGR